MGYASIFESTCIADCFSFYRRSKQSLCVNYFSWVSSCLSSPSPSRVASWWSWVIKRTLPENAVKLEKEKTEIPDTIRCKIELDVKKSVDKTIYDIFRSPSSIQIYIELRDNFTFWIVGLERTIWLIRIVWPRANIIILSFTSSILAFGPLLPSYLVIQTDSKKKQKTFYKTYWLQCERIVRVRTFECMTTARRSLTHGTYALCFGTPSGSILLLTRPITRSSFPFLCDVIGLISALSSLRYSRKRHPFWQDDKQMGPSRKSDMNRQCPGLPSSRPKLLDERESTARRIATRRLINWTRYEKRRRLPHDYCSVEKSQCRERVSKIWRGTQEGNRNLQGHCACICDVEMERIMYYSPSEKERGPESWKKLHVGGITDISYPHLQVMMVNLLQKHREWQKNRLVMLKHDSVKRPSMYLTIKEIKTAFDETRPRHVAQTQEGTLEGHNTLGGIRDDWITRTDHVRVYGE